MNTAVTHAYSTTYPIDEGSAFTIPPSAYYLSRKKLNMSSYTAYVCMYACGILSRDIIHKNKWVVYLRDIMWASRINAQGELMPVLHEHLGSYQRIVAGAGQGPQPCTGLSRDENTVGGWP